jgi:periplasmic divalent cation tolerance protein
MEGQFIVVYVTTPTKEVGEEIAQKLVENKLAACIHLLPGLTSIYYWEGQVHNDAEVLLTIKTEGKCFKALSETVQEIHPYEVPEIIAVPVTTGSKRYLDWITEVTSAA